MCRLQWFPQLYITLCVLVLWVWRLFFLFYFIYFFLGRLLGLYLWAMLHLSYAICSSCTLCCMCSWQIKWWWWWDAGDEVVTKTSCLDQYGVYGCIIRDNIKFRIYAMCNRRRCCQDAGSWPPRPTCVTDREWRKKITARWLAATLQHIHDESNAWSLNLYIIQNDPNKIQNARTNFGT